MEITDMISTKLDHADPLIPKHGGYRKLKSFQIAQLVYDVTVRFCNRYIDRRSRTHDQMVQAARSGVQNIAEGSQASGTSKKTELKLTNVARASLEELRLDYEDFLRQRDLAIWKRDNPRRASLVELRPKTVDDVAKWVKETKMKEEEDRRNGQDGRSGQDEKSSTTSTPSTLSSTSSMSTPSTTSTPSILSTYAEISANAALILIAVAGSLLDRNWQHNPPPSKTRVALPSDSTRDA